MKRYIQQARCGCPAIRGSQTVHLIDCKLHNKAECVICMIEDQHGVSRLRKALRRQIAWIKVLRADGRIPKESLDLAEKDAQDAIDNVGGGR